MSAHHQLYFIFNLTSSFVYGVFDTVKFIFDNLRLVYLVPAKFLKISKSIMLKSRCILSPLHNGHLISSGNVIANAYTLRPQSLESERGSNQLPAQLLY